MPQKDGVATLSDSGETYPYSDVFAGKISHSFTVELQMKAKEGLKWLSNNILYSRCVSFCSESGRTKIHLIHQHKMGRKLSLVLPSFLY